MCDYSLHGLKNRLAVEGERLFVHRFHTGSKGLASAADLRALENQIPAPAGIWARARYWIESLGKPSSQDLMKLLPAVCVPPGARLYVEGIPKDLQETYGLAEAEEAIFTQISLDPFEYRDAFRFKDGPELLIQRFDEQTRVEVLCLRLVEEPAAGISYEQAFGRSERTDA
jgi:hypothetical protein